MVGEPVRERAPPKSPAEAVLACTGLPTGREAGRKTAGEVEDPQADEAEGQEDGRRGFDEEECG